MIFLAGSIVLASYLTLFFKFIERTGLNTFQVIVFNYLTCVTTGSLVNGNFPSYAITQQEPWLLWGVVMGFMFISLFNIVGFTAQKIGVSVASVAYKLSLVIPFIFSIYLYNEKARWLNILGIILALVAVVLTFWKKKSNGIISQEKNFMRIFMPVTLFIGSGLLDAMIKFVEHRFLNEKNNNDFLIIAFASAATIGVVLLLYRTVVLKYPLQPKAIIAGIVLGVPNYFSIWCLIAVLKKYPADSAVILPVNNMAIVLFSALVSWLAFREKLSAANWTGILLSVLAIALIAFG